MLQSPFYRGENTFEVDFFFKFKEISETQKLKLSQLDYLKKVLPTTIEHNLDNYIIRDGFLIINILFALTIVVIVLIFNMTIFTRVST